MNPVTRNEIDTIRERQNIVMDEVRALNTDVATLLYRFDSAPPEKQRPAQSPVVPRPEPSAPTVVRRGNAELSASPAPVAATRHPIPPLIEQKRPEPAATPVLRTAEIEPPASAAESFEMQVGTVWLVRVGMIILLTGLVFLGNYAYRTWVTPMGPGGKLSILMLAASGLFGVGAWLEKKREELVNYARVLMAGGIAAAYYTSYAAHFVDRLRVIESPIIGGTLLLALGGGIVWFANRKRSETVALLAVLLSYYTSAINPIGTFTLFSSLILTAAAVYFAIRNGWVKLSSAALFATYASYGYWRFVQSGAITPAWAGPVFLSGYWALFTTAVFATRALPSSARSTFATLNNGAFFTYASISMALNFREQYWAFAVVFGGVLLVLGALSRRLEKDNTVLDGTYLAQGAIIATAGLIMKLTGPQMAVLLAVESLILARIPRVRQSLLLDFATYGSAIGSVLFATTALDAATPHATSVAVAVIAAHILSAWDAKRRDRLAEPPQFSRVGALRIGLAALLGVAAIAKSVSSINQPFAFALIGIASIASIYLLRIAELPIAGTVFIICAAIVHVLNPFASAPAIAAIAAGLSAAAWWKHQTKLGVELSAKNLGEFASAAVAVVPTLYWMLERQSFASLQPTAALLAVLFACAGIALRSPGVFLVGQTTLVAGLIAFASGLLGSGHWLPPLAIPAAFAALGLLTIHFAKRTEFAFNWNSLARVHFIAALSVLAIWAMNYLPSEWRPVFFGMTGAALLIASRWNSRLHSAGAATAMFALALLIIPTPALQAWGTIAAILLASEFIRIDSDTRPAALFIPALLALSAWQIATRQTIDNHRALLTVAWAVFAFAILILGIIRRERIYRRAGLATIALCVASVFLVDVWRLGTFERITAFLVLGGVLISLGFFYNRFREFIAKWL
jgi:uncharacterized membrane protein